MYDGYFLNRPYQTLEKILCLNVVLFTLHFIKTNNYHLILIHKSVVKKEKKNEKQTQKTNKQTNKQKQPNKNEKHMLFIENPYRMLKKHCDGTDIND